MMTYIKYSKLTCLACLMLLCSLLSACRYDDLTIVKPNENFRLAGDFLKNNYDYSLFYEALNYTGLIEKLNGPGPFTVIAPNNKAFNELGIQLPGDIRKLNRDSLRQAMAYHIITRRLLTDDMPVNGVDVRYETLAGNQLYLSYAAKNLSGGNVDIPFVSGSQVTRKNVQLVNGTLHAVEKVMKQYPGKNVQAWLSERPQYSIFVSALKKFGFWDQLSKGPNTVLAPDNKVFNDAGITQATIDQMDVSMYRPTRLFGLYIISGKSYFMTDRLLFSAINSETDFFMKIPNDDSKFRWYGNQFSVESAIYNVYYNVVNIEGAQLAKTDNLCEDGIVHRLPGLLMKPEQAKK